MKVGDIFYPVGDSEKNYPRKITLITGIWVNYVVCATGVFVRISKDGFRKCFKIDKL